MPRHRTRPAPTLATLAALALAPLLAAGAGLAVAQAPEPSSTYRFGGDGDESVFDLAVAPDGAAYLVGGARGELERPVEGLFDAFVHAVPQDGSDGWTLQLGTSGLDLARAAAVAPNGDLLVAGFSDGDLAGPNAGGSDSWLLRLSPAGEERWRVALGSAGNDEIEDVAVAGDGTIFLAGATTGELAAPGAGGWDLILVALAPDGSERWRVQDGTAQDDRAYVASLAPDGGVYVGLHTQGDLAGPNEGGWDGALRRYDADGAAVWTRHLAHPENLYVLGLASGPDGGAVVAGAGPEGPDDGADVPGFVRAFDADGAERWATAFGPGRRDMPRPVAVAGDGTAFVAATTEADLAGPQAGIADAALLAWGPDGSERWATQLGSPRFEDAVAVTATSDAVLLAGTTQGPLPGAPDDGFDNDGYLMRFPY